MKRGLLVGAMVMLMMLPATASAKLLADSVAQGSHPITHIDLDTYELAGPIRMEVRSNPRARLALELQISCESGPSGSARGYFLPKRKGPFNRRFALPVRNPDNCNILADARFDEDVGGRIALRIFG